MISISDKESCCGCKACYNICPKECIEIVADDEGFWYPEVNEQNCVNCGLCEKVCPEINIYNNYDSESKPICLAAWNNNENVRNESSSGGIFTALSQWILSNNGIVFGAGYDSNLNIIHKEIDAIHDLDELKGSKYVQSDINTMYKRAKYQLDNGKKVLFTGTPCQIAGLYNFLQKRYDELYTCDLVCHGVPSPKVYSQYKKSMIKKYNSDIQKLCFRDKEYGWKVFSVSLKFNSGKNYIETLYDDVYMQGFLKNYYLRPSCYRCSYSKLPRVSDLTLADFWGVADKYPELDDDKGTSLLLINTANGKKMIDGSSNGIFIRECDLNHAILNNPCIIKSVDEPNIRTEFFKDFNTKDFNYVAKKYMKNSSIFKKVAKRIKRKLISSIK